MNEHECRNKKRMKAVINENEFSLGGNEDMNQNT